MNPFLKKCLLTSAAGILTIVIVSCGSSNKPVTSPTPSSEGGSDILPNDTSGMDKPETDSYKNGTPVSSAAETPKPGGTGSNGESRNWTYSGEAYSSENPVLMGLAVGNSREKVIALYGEEDLEYIMDDPGDPITVLDYSGFRVGLDTSGKVKFVSIESDRIDPGLGGVKLGSANHAAVEALGDPDTDTSFVLAYYAMETILKLDIDPGNSQIRSIKLFGEARLQ